MAVNLWRRLSSSRHNSSRLERLTLEPHLSAHLLQKLRVYKLNLLMRSKQLRISTQMYLILLPHLVPLSLVSIHRSASITSRSLCAKVNHLNLTLLQTIMAIKMVKKTLTKILNLMRQILISGNRWVPLSKSNMALLVMQIKTFASKTILCRMLLAISSTLVYMSHPNLFASYKRI